MQSASTLASLRIFVHFVARDCDKYKNLLLAQMKNKFSFLKGGLA